MEWHLNSFVAELKANEQNPRRFHQIWNRMAAHGRVTARGRGRLFQSDTEPAAATLEEDGENWRDYIGRSTP